MVCCGVVGVTLLYVRVGGFLVEFRLYCCVVVLSAGVSEVGGGVCVCVCVGGRGATEGSGGRRGSW